MMRVLLVSASRGESREPVFPVGPAYVASALLREGAEVEVFDAGFHPSPLRSLRSAIERFPPDIVGLSLRYIDNAAYPRSRCYLPEYAGIVSEIRAASRAPILLGGSAFSLFPEDLMRILRAEGGTTGDGEDGMLRLLRGEEGRVRGRLQAEIKALSRLIRHSGTFSLTRATPLRISVAEFARIRAIAAASPKSGDFGYIVLA